jgi:hypothetical protein
MQSETHEDLKYNENPQNYEKQRKFHQTNK